MLNNGTLGVSFGTSDIFGDIEVMGVGPDPAQVIVSGNANATFYGNVVNNGELRVSTGSTGVFFGQVSGSGAFTGGGTVFFEGGFSPGSSPDEVTIGFNLIYGPSNVLTMEIGGTIPGDEHDKVIYNGDITLDGILDVVLIDPLSDVGSNVYDPQFGDVFDLFDYNADLFGAFADINLPTLSGGLFWDDSQLYTTGTLAVIPEPATLALLAVGGVVMLKRRRE